MLSYNSVDRVNMPPSSPARNRRLEDGEFEQLEEAAKQTKNPHIWLVIVPAIETGMLFQYTHLRAEETIHKL